MEKEELQLIRSLTPFKDMGDDEFKSALSQARLLKVPKGKMVFTYEMDKVKPAGWTDSGVEVIHRIDWTGERQQHAAAKHVKSVGLNVVQTFKPLKRALVRAACHGVSL